MTYREELKEIRDYFHNASTPYLVATAGLAIIEQLEQNKKGVVTENSPNGIPLIINPDLLKELDQDA